MKTNYMLSDRDTVVILGECTQTMEYFAKK